jgi:hypothetical protein
MTGMMATVNPCGIAMPHGLTVAIIPVITA